MKLYATLANEYRGRVDVRDDRGHRIPRVFASKFEARQGQASRITLEIVVDGDAVQIGDPPKQELGESSERVDRLEKALMTAATWFEEYTKTPDVAAAERNSIRATVLRTAIAEDCPVEVERDHRETLRRMREHYEK